MVLKGHLLQRADPDRGRFRSLLLKALKDFLANARIKSPDPKTWRRRAVCVMGRMDGRGAVAFVDLCQGS